MGIVTSWRPARLIRRTGLANDTCLWGPRPLLLVGKQAAGTRVASSPDSDLEAFSHNPAHGRADIEGSKSNVAMNAWLPQASYPCDVPPQPNSPPDNVFRPDRPAEAGLGSKKRGICPASDSRNNRIPLVRTSSELAVRRPGKAPEGAVPSPSPGRHAATRSRRGSSSSSPPTADGFGTGTPVPSPQSQSFSRGYGSILPTSLAYIVPSTRGCSPWRPDAVMSTTGRGRHSVLRIFKGRRGRTGHRATCGALPAAGPYLRLSHPHRRPLRPGSRPRFCSDRRALLLIGAGTCPDGPGVGRALKRHPFSGLVDSAGELSAQFGTVTRLPVHPASPVLLTKNGPLGALDSVARLNEAAAPSYLFKNSHPGSSYPEGNFGGNQLLDGSISLSPLIPKSDERFARMLTLEPFSEDQGRSAVHPARGIPPISFLAPCGFTHPLTRTHVRLLGPCFKTGRMGCPQAGAGRHAGISPRRRVLPTTIDATASPRAYRQLGLWPPHQSAPVHAPSRSADRLSPFHIRPGRIAGPHSLPSRQFQALFDSLFKVLFIFPSPGPGTTGLSPSLAPPSRGLGPGPAAEDASPDYNSDSEAVRFSSWADPGSLAVTKGILVEASSQDDTLGSSSRASLTAHDTRHNTRVFSTTTSRASTEGDSSLGQPHHKHGRPISAPMPCVPIRDAWLGATRCVTPRQAVPSGRMALGATCVQKLDGSRDSCNSHQVHVHGSFCFAGFDNDPSAGSPTETLLRLLLPLNDKVQWNSRDVAGGEPPTSPRS
ncbi:hypothetical protein L1887_46884 [Cichorium endivia]|nr:hypothetical protein L1887_46884 [Cichorium endivia]